MRAQTVPPAGRAHPQALGVIVRRALAGRQQGAAQLHAERMLSNILSTPTPVCWAMLTSTISPSQAS